MKMTRFFALISILLSYITMSAKSAEAVKDSLLRELDLVVADRSRYEAEQHKEMQKLWKHYNMASSAEERYYAVANLFDQYRNFSMDTAMLLAKEAEELAKKTNDNMHIWSAKLMLSEAYKGFGNYSRALAILDSLPPESHEALRVKILNRYCSVYYSLSENRDNTLENREKLLYYRTELARFSPSAQTRTINTLEILKQKGEMEGALKLYDRYVDSIAHHGEEVDDMMRYIAGELYLMKGDTITALNYMARVAINDMRSGVRKYTSLPAIAKILYAQGDYKRAYNYIITSLEDVRKSNAQSRLPKVLESLPIISRAYDEQQRAERKTRTIYTSIVVVLAALLAVALFGIFRRNKRLKSDHVKLSESHRELRELKEHLDKLNTQLSVENQCKEEYIMNLFNLCHEYIQLMSSHHNSLLKLIKSGAKMSAVEKYITEMGVSDEMSNFFAKFDKTILAIFPNFIEKFNALMQPEYQTDPTSKTLTPELRIYALVRLGMKDTTKIAVLLHYSPQTVYNYRFRARQHSIYAKEEFLEAVMKL